MHGLVCVCLCVREREGADLSLIEPLDGGVGSVSVAGLHGVLRADSQHRAGVAAGPVSHHNYAGPLTARDLPQVFVRELTVNTHGETISCTYVYTFLLFSFYRMF